jgi:hypothetical protein
MMQPIEETVASSEASPPSVSPVNSQPKVPLRELFTASD